MKNKAKIVLSVIAAVLTLSTTAVLTGVMTGGAQAQNAFTKDACKGLDAEQKAALGCEENRTAGGVAVDLINVAIGLVGVVAVIAIIIGGVQYATSAGDAAKVKTAKNTIMYAVIGLVVAILSFAIVRFVVTEGGLR